MTIAQIVLLNPQAESASREHPLAPRAPSLDGKIVALLDNSKDLVDVLLGEVREMLAKRFPRAQFRYFHKESVSGLRPEMLADVARCDAVVTAVGD